MVSLLHRATINKSARGPASVRSFTVTASTVVSAGIEVNRRTTAFSTGRSDGRIPVECCRRRDQASLRRLLPRVTSGTMPRGRRGRSGRRSAADLLQSSEVNTRTLPPTVTLVSASSLEGGSDAAKRSVDSRKHGSRSSIGRLFCACATKKMVNAQEYNKMCLDL